MHHSAIRLVDDGTVATLQLARPETRNRIDQALVEDLTRALFRLEDEGTAAVVLVRGAGAFCTGFDWDDYAGGAPPDIGAFTKWERAVAALERLPSATLAVVEGACLGAGLDLALACDLRVASAGATLGVPDVPNGRLPSMATFRLPKFVGLGAARRLLLTGEVWTATEAAAAGLLDRVVDEAEIEPAVRAAIATLAKAPGPAVAMARRLLNEAYATGPEDALGNFLAAQDRCLRNGAATRETTAR